eukprot:gene38249-47226_t
MQYPHVFLRTAAVFSAIAAFFSIPWTLAGANIALLCLVLTWLLAGGWRQRWDVARGNAVTLPLLALYAIILLGAVYTTAPWRVVLDHWLKYDKLLLMVIAISLLAQDEKTRERCWTAFTIAALFTLASSYLSIWWRLPWSRAQTLGWGGDHSVFKDYITQSVLMALLMLRGLYLALRANVAWQRGAWLAVAACCMGARAMWPPRWRCWPLCWRWCRCVGGGWLWHWSPCCWRAPYCCRPPLVRVWH